MLTFCDLLAGGKVGDKISTVNYDCNGSAESCDLFVVVSVVSDVDDCSEYVELNRVHVVNVNGSALSLVFHRIAYKLSNRHSGPDEVNILRVAFENVETKVLNVLVADGDCLYEAAFNFMNSVKELHCMEFEKSLINSF